MVKDVTCILDECDDLVPYFECKAMLGTSIWCVRVGRGENWWYHGERRIQVQVNRAADPGGNSSVQVNKAADPG